MLQKECKKCGEKIATGANFCTKCGGNEFNELTTQVVNESLTKPKKLNKKKNFIIIGVVILLVIMISVFSKNDDSDSETAKTTSTQNVNDVFAEDDEYVEPDINFDLSEDDEYVESDINFDLSEYDSYGELSCGLIWVEKTVSSYDKAPESKFAFADVDGNIKSQWFASEDFQKADFMNGIVVLKGSARCLVYDTQFNELINAHFKIIENYYGQVEGIAIVDANERGEVFGIANLDGNGDGLFMINKKGVVKFAVSENALVWESVSNLERIEYDNGYYIIDFRADIGNIPAYMGIFDENGKCIFEPSEELDYMVFSVKVISKNRFEIKFEGKDEEHYTVEIDDTGEFLTEPTRVE